MCDKLDGLKINNETISPLSKEGLCTGCGTCVAMCPEDAIKVMIDYEDNIYVPEINEKKCINCGTCLNVCSGSGVNFNKLNLEVFRKKNEDSIVGTYLNCYLSYSKNREIRYNSSSGGLVTQVLIFALEQGIINGALVTRMKKEKPLETESFIARTKNEIIEASKSKYCPVPANMALKEILNAPIHEKFAVVGLPCHIHGIRKAECLNEALKNKIVLHLGLFCHHGLNFEATNFFLNSLEINKENINNIEYRGTGWPGYFKVTLKNKNIKKDLFSNFFNFPSIYFFTPRRCFMCSDALNELSDISFGDAWLPEYAEEKKGISVLVSRNEKGDQLLKKLEKENKVKLKVCNTSKVVKSQPHALYFKKKTLKARKNISITFNKPFTTDDTYLLESDIFDYLFIFFIYFNNYLSSFKIVQRFSQSIPTIFIMGYKFIFFRFINSRNLNK